MERAFWDERYSADELVYGEGPNGFLAGLADRLPRDGCAVDLGAGEGRNALFLASLGLDVLAVDQSPVGMAKAARVAASRGLGLRTQVADLLEFAVEPGSVDVVSSIFVHLPSAVRRAVHGRVHEWLRPGGVFVLEAYAPDQIGRGTGGPNDPDRLVSLDVVTGELAGLEIEHAAAVVRDVTEGMSHTGEASVVQVFGRKMG